MAIIFLALFMLFAVGCSPRTLVTLESFETAARDRGYRLVDTDTNPNWHSVDNITT